MKPKLSAPRKQADKAPDASRLDRVVAQSQRERETRAKGYRDQALKILPWVCGRCGREFTHANLHELTVHHKDHNHDNNPDDGSNWELLCRYCHDNEHSRHLDALAAGAAAADAKRQETATHKPFANLKAMLDASNNNKK
jgi:5-methylcytosine-specific restriction endonuclease McrA